MQVCAPSCEMQLIDACMPVQGRSSLLPSAEMMGYWEMATRAKATEQATSEAIITMKITHTFVTINGELK
jgi:hypothetical protein